MHFLRVGKMYESLIFTGGVHKSEEIKELIEDLGGFILQESIQQMELVLNLAVPIEDVDKIEEKSGELLGKLAVAPMAGSEIAIISPTLARHHLPHAACDISEYLREFGAKDNMIGLARGDGKGTSGITEEEKSLIEEHDIAVFALGSFENCIKEKAFLYDDIDIPVIVTGAPEIPVEELPGVIVIGHFVNGEYINVYANVLLLVLLLFHQCPVVINLCKAVSPFSCPVQRGHLESVEVNIGKEGVQPFKVLSEHVDVDVIVPRNIALMANRSKHGSAGQRIADARFLTKRVYCIQYLYLYLLSLFNSDDSHNAGLPDVYELT